MIASNELTQTLPNSGRQIEIDLVKALAIFFMIFGHTLDILHPNAQLETGSILTYSNTVFLLGNMLSPGSFMFCLGVGLIYSRHQSARDQFRRGLSLLGVGYGLNFSAFLIVLIGPRSVSQIRWDVIFCGDILQFAGVAFFVWGAALYFRVKPAVLAACSLIFMFLGDHFAGRLVTGSIPLNALIGLFLWTDDNSFFPLALWFPYIAAGICFGGLLIQTADKRRFYGKIAIFSTGLILLWTGCAAFFHWDLRPIFFDYEAVFKQTPLSFWITISVGMLWLSLAYVICLYLGEKPAAANAILRWSRNITWIFCIQWLILFSLRKIKTIWFSKITFSPLWLILTSVLILLASDFLASFFRKKMILLNPNRNKGIEK